MKIYKFNENYYRIVINKIYLRKKTIEEQLSDGTFNSFSDSEERKMRSLLNSVQRSKAIIREYAHCNDFNYFVTFTFDDEKIDRYDYNLIKQKLTRFFNNYKNKKQQNFKYLIVPEFHKDGAIHFHGLLYIDEEELTENENGYLTWLRYQKRFGYISLSKIVDKDKTANYITKYVTKDIALAEKYKNRYFCSSGLKKKELLIELPTLPDTFEKIDFFESEVAFIKDVDYNELHKILGDYFYCCYNIYNF
jgi:hypothetical protein